MRARNYMLFTSRRCLFSCLFITIISVITFSTHITNLGAANVTFVTNGEELQAALNAKNTGTIVLKDGVYESNGFFIRACGHRIEAENIGKAIIRAGLSIGGKFCPAGTTVNGLRFDVADPQKALNGHVINVWGQAKSTTLTDLTIYGNNIMQSGIAVRQPDGAVLKRIIVKGFKSFGIVIQSEKRVQFTDKHELKSPVVLDSISVSDVSRDIPKSSIGTAEACVWAGEPMIASDLTLERCAWMGLWTGSATDGSTFSNVSVRDSETGLYLGHYTRRTTFQDIRIGPGVKFGIKCEWAAPQWKNIAACYNVIIEDADIHSSCAGVILDAGTQNTTIRQSVFYDQQAFAIGNFHGSGNLWDTTGNDVSDIPAGAVALYTAGPTKAISACNK